MLPPSPWVYIAFGGRSLTQTVTDVSVILPSCYETEGKDLMGSAALPSWRFRPAERCRNDDANRLSIRVDRVTLNPKTLHHWIDIPVVDKTCTHNCPSLLAGQSLRHYGRHQLNRLGFLQAFVRAESLIREDFGIFTIPFYTMRYIKRSV